MDILGLRVAQRPSSRYALFDIVRRIQSDCCRFSDVLTDAKSLLPSAPYERDPTIDHANNRAVLYTMATCHSLRVVDKELVGDPLDLKMFEFTGWSFEEGKHQTDQFDEVDEVDEGKLSPSVARPPPGLEYDLDTIRTESGAVRVREHGGIMTENQQSLTTGLGILKSFEFVSQLRRASVVVRQVGAAEGDVYVKGAPECMKDICMGDSRR